MEFPFAAAPASSPIDAFADAWREVSGPGVPLDAPAEAPGEVRGLKELPCGRYSWMADARFTSEVCRAPSSAREFESQTTGMNDDAHAIIVALDSPGVTTDSPPRSAAITE